MIIDIGKIVLAVSKILFVVDIKSWHQFTVYVLATKENQSAQIMCLR